MTQINDSLAKNNTELDLFILNYNKTSIKTSKKFVCKIHKVYNNTDFIFVFTTQPINKYLHNVKNRNNKTKLKLVSILQTKYNTDFIEIFYYDNKEEINNKLNLLNNPKIDIITNSKINDLNYGLTEEDKVFALIKNYFINDEIEKATYKYSKFDFIGLKSKYLYELKSNRDKFEDYPTAIIGVNKIIEHAKQIFLFQFTTETDCNELYYFIKPNNFISNYKQREIYLKNRNIINLVYDIPRTELKKINKKEICCIDLDLTDNELFNHLYNLDKIRADIH